MVYETLVSTTMLAEHLDDPSWVVFDCRFTLADPDQGERAYHHGHIPGARYVHLDRDLSAPITAISGRHPLPDRETLIAKLSGWGVSQHSQVVAYDDAGGAFAARLWWLLRWLGHRETAVVDGGWGQWLKEGRQVTTEKVSVSPSVFRVASSLTGWLDADQVTEGLTSGTIRLLDARGAERFRGEVEPVDRVAGHVPGASNRPFQNNLGEDGCFLPRDELCRGLEQSIAGFQPAQVVHMCGSGVTACHNLLAMEIAGLTGSRLYPGSWSEWICDPARPVAKGDG